MSTKHLFLTLLAAFSLAFACQKPEANLSLPSIEISLTEAAVAEPASSFTVQVVSNRAWRVTSDVPWIAVDPDSGSGSMTGTPVTVFTVAGSRRVKTPTSSVSGFCRTAASTPRPRFPYP